MWFIGRLNRNKRGAGSIVGAVFIVLILLSGFTYYTLQVNATKDYTNTLQDMQQLDLKRSKENIEFTSVSINTNDKLNITVKNTGDHQAHLIWLGIFDETVIPATQEYHELDVYVELVETVTNIPEGNITILEGQERVIQLVTELGNTFSYSYPPSEEKAQASVTITGKNGTATYNASEWNTLGSTEHVNGTVSDLASDDGDYVVFRSYSSGNVTNITLLDDGFEAADWDANWDDIPHNWQEDNSLVHNGSASAWADNTHDGYFICDDLEDASGAEAIYIDFWFRKDRTEPTDFTLYYFDGTDYDLIDELDDNGPDNTWLHYTQNVTDSQYFVSNFRIQFDATLGQSENVWVDDVSIKKQAEEYTAEVEFAGSSNLEDWTRLDWQIDSCWDTGKVNITIQLYNYTLGGYAPSGDGYLSYVSATTPNTDELKSQTITSNPDDFKNLTGHWRVKIKGVKSASTQFLVKIDWIELNLTYSSLGDTIPYGAWQWYTIEAATGDGDPIPYAYISIYANGKDMAFRDAVSKESVSNPGWVRLNAEGEYNLEIRSIHESEETLILYAVAGSTVDQKTVKQEAP